MNEFLIIFIIQILPILILVLSPKFRKDSGGLLGVFCLLIIPFLPIINFIFYSIEYINNKNKSKNNTSEKPKEKLDNKGTKSTYKESTISYQPSDIIQGIAKVIDGDTIKINNKSIRLSSLDAPEDDQIDVISIDKCGCKYCKNNPDDKKFIIKFSDYAGKGATLFLKNYIENKEVTVKTEGLDYYRRILGTIYIDEIDINKKIVEEGWAIAIGNRYKEIENKAKKNNKGMWKYSSMTPKLWRDEGRFHWKSLVSLYKN